MKGLLTAGFLSCSLLFSSLGFAQNYSQHTDYSGSQYLAEDASYSHPIDSSNFLNSQNTYGNTQKGNYPNSSNQDQTTTYGNSKQAQMGSYQNLDLGAKNSYHPINDKPSTIYQDDSQSYSLSQQPSNYSGGDYANSAYQGEAPSPNQQPDFEYGNYEPHTRQLPFNPDGIEHYNSGGTAYGYGSAQYTQENDNPYPSPVDLQVSAAKDGCWCLYCQYEPCYYDDWRCVEEQKHCQRQCCRYIPKYYEVQHCKYVPQFYSETYCRYEPEYYMADDVRPVRRWICEKKCKMNPKYYYRHVCGDPSCTTPCPATPG